jgi:hypothetical protein
VFPSNLLEKLFREMYAGKTYVPNIEARIVRDVDPERFRKITSSTLEGLALPVHGMSGALGAQWASIGRSRRGLMQRRRRA